MPLFKVIYCKSKCSHVLEAESVASVIAHYKATYPWITVDSVEPFSHPPKKRGGRKPIVTGKRRVNKKIVPIEEPEPEELPEIEPEEPEAEIDYLEEMYG